MPEEMIIRLVYFVVGYILATISAVIAMNRG